METKRMSWEINLCVLMLLVFFAGPLAVAQFDPSLTDEEIEQISLTMTEEEKLSMVDQPESEEPQMLTVQQVENAEPAPAGLLYPLSDGGWSLVDFCTAGCTGSGSACYYDCYDNDDDSAYDSIPFTFLFYGVPYTDVYINNNGNLSFGTLFSTYTAYGFPVSGYPMLGTFWADVDTRGGYGDVYYKSIPEKNTFVVTWDAVGYYSYQGDKRNTFQIAISDGTNPDLGLGNNVCFSYNDMQWTTGSASGGSGGFWGTPATVGVNKGDGVEFAQIGRFDHPGTDYDGPGGFADGVDYLDGQRFFFNISGLENNIPPVAQGFPLNNLATAECGVPFGLTVQFSSPELGQTTSVVVSDVDDIQARGLVITSSPGNPATVNLNWTPSSADTGIYELVITSTDDGLPPQSTVTSLFIEVICSNQSPVAICQDITMESCGEDVSVDGGSYDPDGDPFTIEQVPAGPYPLGSTEVTLTVTDDSDFTDTCTAIVTLLDTTPPEILSMTADALVVPVNQVITFSAESYDTCDPEVDELWDCGDGTAPSSAPTHAYTQAGIYTVTCTATDDSGNTSTATIMIIVYDPSGGFVTGGGWIDSPAGAYIADPLLVGKANFGFVSKYQKGKTVPTGKTEFQFKAAGLNFHSSTYQWLVVNQGGTNAQFKGTGTINGEGVYQFMLWAGDAEVDTFRVRIWEEDELGVEANIYDNGVQQEIAGGSVVIHTKKK